MIRSSNKDLVQPFKNPKQVFRSSRKLSKTRSPDYWSSPEFSLISDSKDQFEEEETEIMGEPTMEEYMTQTREGYGSRIARPKIDEKARFELKGQFLKELRDNTFSVSDNEDANEHIEKVLKIVAFDLLRDALSAIFDFRTQDMQEVILFYKGLDVPTRQILDSKGAIPSIKVADAKNAIQDMADHSQKWHNETSTRCRSTKTFDGLAAIQAQLNDCLGGTSKMLSSKGFKVEEKLVHLRMVVKFELLIEKKKMCSLGLMRFDWLMEFLMVHLEELEMKKLL
ncbi:hypothetical protein Tco_1402228 [Tanacetum coccineum]